MMDSWNCTESVDTTSARVGWVEALEDGDTEGSALESLTAMPIEMFAITSDAISGSYFPLIVVVLL